MTVGILLITHSGIGQALIATLINTFGDLRMPMKSISIGKEPDPELLSSQACQDARELNQGAGILVFTDMIGSTPCNIAQRVRAADVDVRVITGVNLPMLFRVLNYPDLPLEVLAQKALMAGREGILEPSRDPRLVLVPTRKSRTKHQIKRKIYDSKASSNHQ